MSIVIWTDHEGDSVAIDSATIVGLSVGTINGPHKVGAEILVTLVWVDGVGQPFMVASTFADVLHRWTESRGESLAMKAHPGAYPLVQHQYAPSRRLDGR